MGGGSWKVAYADFVTAMMAFFLLMWLLSISDEDTKKGLAAYFTADAQPQSDSSTPIGVANNPLIQYVDKLDPRNKMDETETSNYNTIAKPLRTYLMQDAVPASSSGITSDNVGVLLHITPDIMFKPGTVEFTDQGKRALNEVATLMSKYKVYLVVRGHAASQENDVWGVSAARANAAVRYLVDHGANPGYIRSVAYADTRPKVASTDPDAANQNARLEFNFHRPEVMATIVGY